MLYAGVKDIKANNFELSAASKYLKSSFVAL